MGDCAVFLLYGTDVQPFWIDFAVLATVPDFTFPSDDTVLRHPLSAVDERYATIDGKRLKTYVEEQTAISRRYRDKGHQFWGRIIGTQSDAETAEWMAAKLRQAGASNVRIDSIDLPSQWMPQSWEIVASSGAVRLTLGSSWPAYGTTPTPGAGLDLEVVYLGWGTEADLAGRDVQGKAAFIYSMPTSGSIRHTATANGALQRAAERGAAAIFVVIELPGNTRHVLASSVAPVPTFSLSSADGAAIRKLIEEAAIGKPPRLRVQLDVDMVPGLRTANVSGEIPGPAGSGDVVVVAHRDAFLEGAGDNATGVATVIGLAEYFAKTPAAERTRTIKLIGTPGHHDLGATGPQWLLANRENVLGKTALLINAEHTAYTLVDRWGPDLMPTNVIGPFTWTVNGSSRLLQIANSAFDAFGVPRWVAQGGPSGEFSRVRNLVPSLGLMHAWALLHTDAETAASIPAAGLAAVTRAYAKIIDEVNKVDVADLRAVK